MKILHFAAGAAALILSAPATAADFTFEVPVNIQNVPSMTMARIRCVVSRRAIGGPAVGGSDFIGRSEVTLPISGGTFNDVVIIEVDPDGIIPSSEARSYSCSIYALGTARTGSNYAASYGNFREVYETATGHTLDRLVAHVQSNFP